MIRKLSCAVFVMSVALGFVAAGEYRASITEVKDGKVTFYKVTGKGKESKKDENSITLSTAANVTVVKAKFKKGEAPTDGDAIEGGLSAKVFQKIGKKGIGALIVTEGTGDNEKITKIRIMGGKKKKKADAQ